MKAYSNQRWYKGMTPYSNKGERPRQKKAARRVAKMQIRKYIGRIQ